MHKPPALLLSSKPLLGRTKSRMVRLCFVLFLCLGLGGLSSCGSPSEGGFGVRLQGLDAAILARMRFLDIAIFPASKVACNQVNATNYTKSGAFAADHLGEFPVRFEGTERRAIINELPEGNDLVLYFLGLESVGEEKKALAQGCASGITLKKAEITVVNVTMNAL